MTYCSICKGSGMTEVPHVPSQVSKYATGSGWMDQNYYSSGIPCGACNGTGQEATTNDGIKHSKDDDDGSNLKQQNHTSNASTNVTYEMFLPDTKIDFDFMSLAKAAVTKEQNEETSDTKRKASK